MDKKRPKIKKIVERYVAELKKQGLDVSAVYLYGSYAKGTPKEYSDIDIAVVSPSFRKMDIFERQIILCRAHHNFGEPIEPIGFTPKQILDKEGFAREVVENGVVVYKSAKGSNKGSGS